MCAELTNSLQTCLNLPEYVGLQANMQPRSSMEVDFDDGIDFLFY